MDDSRPNIAVIITLLSCGRCKYEWLPRARRAPLRCPACGAFDWYIGRPNSAARVPPIKEPPCPPSMT